MPHPQWVKVEDVTISDDQLSRAAEVLQAQLGPDGIRQVGGPKWWQWRKTKSNLEAQWIEMRSDAYERKKQGGNCRRVMMYIHGGAYFFGSVDEHRYQMQRHARKLKARVFAPRYRLAPQFPFPCGLQDCLAAYLHLLTVQDPDTIVLAGDSAGGGMVVSLLCVLRDQGLPLPAGAILISPWVDLTHSFPSVSNDAPLDYIPQAGFHHKPSRAWPPPNEDEIAILRDEALKKKKGKTKEDTGTQELKEKQQAPIAEGNGSPSLASSRSAWINGGAPTDPAQLLSVEIDGKLIKIKDQIQVCCLSQVPKTTINWTRCTQPMSFLLILLSVRSCSQPLEDYHRCLSWLEEERFSVMNKFTWLTSAPIPKSMPCQMRPWTKRQRRC